MQEEGKEEVVDGGILREKKKCSDETRLQKMRGDVRVGNKGGGERREKDGKNRERKVH